VNKLARVPDIRCNDRMEIKEQLEGEQEMTF